MIRSALSSALLRLSLSYLAIIMAFSLAFSILQYNLSTHEFDRELRRPAPQDVGQPLNFINFEVFREARINDSRENLRQGLILFNIGVLGFGGLISYALARRTLEPIEAVMESQSRFTADASHELRTPLTAIQTEIEVALRDKNLTQKEARALLQSNLEEVAKLRSLSDQLLRLARSEEPTIKQLSVKPIVDESIKQVQALAKAKHIKLVNQSASFNVIGDSQGLKDSLVILLDNAIKYSAEGQSITLSGQRKDGRGVLSVEDNGTGISKKDLPHIFDRFYRSDQSRSKNQVSGYGLGLAIAKQLIESQNGDLSVKSIVGKGTTFTISLPANKSSQLMTASF